MAIEWGTTTYTSPVSHFVQDNSTQLPTNVLKKGAPFNVVVSWSVPGPLVSFINASDSFRIRVFVESMGPGQEMQLAMMDVPGIAAYSAPYMQTITVAANTLLADGELFGGVPVAGLYKVLCVIHHLSAGVPTPDAGCSNVEPTIMITN